jgi:transglutaminase/protease-like cytokinesis protein 3
MRITLSLLLIVFSFWSFAQHVDFHNENFDKADSIASLYKGHSLQNRESLTKKLTAGLTTDLEKYRSIFKWIAENIAYDAELYDRNIENTKKFAREKEKLKQWRRQFAKQTEQNTILKKLAVCDGYASLLEEMCSIANIPCKKISGQGRIALLREPQGNNHAWNAVQLNNKWYLTDPTWASGTVDPYVHRFHRSFTESYFLADPYFMKLKHFPKDSSWFLLREKPDYKEFNSYPVVYSEGFSENKINQFFPVSGFITTSVREEVVFQISSNLKSVKSLGITIYHDKESQEVRLESDAILRNGEGLYSVRHTFGKKGHYRVDVFANNHYVLGYDVTVK